MKILTIIMVLLAVTAMGFTDELERVRAATFIAKINFEIVSANNDTLINGSFGLFNGYINEREYYFVFEKTANGYRRRYLPAAFTTIIETSETPHVYVELRYSTFYSIALKSMEKKYGLNAEDDVSSILYQKIELHVPADTIIKQFWIE